MIPAGDSLAPGQLIPIVCKCGRLYLNSGSEPCWELESQLGWGGLLPSCMAKQHPG